MTRRRQAEARRRHQAEEMAPEGPCEPTRTTETAETPETRIAGLEELERDIAALEAELEETPTSSMTWPERPLVERLREMAGLTGDW